jgi:hypothetical protein
MGFDLGHWLAGDNSFLAKDGAFAQHTRGMDFSGNAERDYQKRLADEARVKAAYEATRAGMARGPAQDPAAAPAPVAPPAPVPASSTATAPANQENSDFLNKIKSYISGTTMTPAEQQYAQGSGAAQGDISSNMMSNQAGQNIGDLTTDAARAHSTLGQNQQQGLGLLRAGEMPGLVSSLAGGAANAGAQGQAGQATDLTNKVNSVSDTQAGVAGDTSAAAGGQQTSIGADQNRVQPYRDAYRQAVAQYGQDSAQAKQVEQTALSIGITLAMLAA